MVSDKKDTGATTVARVEVIRWIRQGAAAAHLGKGWETCPYKAGPQRDAWLHGHQTATGWENV